MNECNYTIHTLRLLTGPCHIQAWRAFCVSILSINWYCGLKHVELCKGTACFIYCIFLHLVLTRAVKNIGYLSGSVISLPLISSANYHFLSAASAF